MHAANLAEGRPYTAIQYVPNPDAPWIAPAHGYPPVFPLLLAPVYKLRGLDLRAMKMVTLLCFGVFLASYAALLRKELPAWLCFAAILIVGANIVFWDQRDQLLSEFPYLMFSFAALLLSQRVYAELNPRAWHIGAAAALSVLLYAAYGTRTIGIVLLPALLLADILKFRRPSRFVIAVTAITLSLIVVQNVLLISPRAYVDALHVSAGSVWRHFLFYGKTLSYSWRNGSSKAAQIAFALVFTSMAAAAFVKRILGRPFMTEFYLLGYAAVLTAWSAEVGLRGLLPILPLYFAYGLEGFAEISGRFGRPARACLAALLFAVMAASYAGAFRWYARQEPPANVRDRSVQALFAYIRQNTNPGDVLIFTSPRSMALFTGRPAGTLAPGESPEQAASFFAAVKAKYLIQTEAMPYDVVALAARKELEPTPVFQNSTFRVFVIRAAQ